MVEKTFLRQSLHQEVGEVIRFDRDFVLRRVVAFRFADDRAVGKLVYFLQGDGVIFIFQNVRNQGGVSCGVCCLNPAVRIQSQ
ncbi:hypothetical protein SDC9_162546 [bioreactor metagenome]|uniref:Uncharacterized protein n=1 Tax=bioreactor metagenome TaxID=1076179 RepID=A0A645FLC5_9ZZZZ